MFSARGSRSKLYYPWWPAGGEFSNGIADQLRKQFWKELVELYSAHLVELQETSRRRSDGGVATELFQEAGGSLVSGEDLESAKHTADRDFE